MKADKIIKNARNFTLDHSNPQATAPAVNDGKFVYVGEANDLNRKFIMPGIIDSHVHITTAERIIGEKHYVQAQYCQIV